MRYNKEDLFALATQSSHKYDKEGILLLREKSEGFFRRTEGSTRSEKPSKMKLDSLSCVGPNGTVSSERWFRLSGNLLFYLKTRDHWSEPMGLIVLENYTVKSDSRPTAQGTTGFHFVIEFESGGYQCLGAHSEAERMAWMDALKHASFSAIRAKLTSLKLQIQSKLSMGSLLHSTGAYSEEGTPIDEPGPIKGSGYVRDVSESPLCEISLSCDNLLCDSHGRAPSAKCVIHVRNMGGQTWVKYASTELVERSSNPAFLTTISFRESDGLNDHSEARFTLYNVRERMSGTQTMIGHLIVNLGSLKVIDRIRLPISASSAQPGSTPHQHVGFLTFVIWNLEREERGSTESTPCRTTVTQPQLSHRHHQQKSECSSEFENQHIGATSSHSFSHRRTQSLPPRLCYKLKIPRQNYFGILFSHPFMQTYRFHSGLGGDIFVHEIMAECKLSFLFPQQLLSLWIAEEKELVQEMIGLGELREPWHSTQVKLLERHLWLINVYTQARNNLFHYKGTNFKLSSTKFDPTYEFVPLNLHLQRIWAQNESLHKNGFHDIMTTGAFTATAQGFQQGGLLKMLQNYKLFETNEKVSGQKSHSAFYLSNKVNMTYDSVQGIKRLRKEIVERMQLIMKLAKERKTHGLHRFVEDIYHRCRLLLSICDQSLIEEAFEFLEHQKLSIPTSTSLDFDVALGRADAPKLIMDEGIETPNSPLRSIVELFKKRAEINKEGSSPDRTPDSGLGIEEVVKSFLDSPSSNYYRPTEEPEPWDLTQLNIEASVISLNSKVTTLAGQGANISFSSFRPINPIQRAQSVKTHLNLSNLKTTPNSWRKSLREESLCSTGTTVERKEGKLPLSLHIPSSTTDGPSTSSVDQSTRHSNKEDWSEELRASLKKLRLAMDGLLKTSRLAHSIFRLQENPEKSRLGFTIKYRRDICFSQALTALVTALMGRLWCPKPDPSFLYVMTRQGPLVTFNSFVTYYSDEAAMFCDMKVAIDDLKSVEFVLTLHSEKKSEEDGESDSDPKLAFPMPKVSGSRSNLKVLLPVPNAVFAMLPLGNSRSTSFVVTPLFFNIGINETATYAERFKNMEPQEKSNIENFERLLIYHRQYKSLSLPVKYNTTKRNATPEPSIGRLLENMREELHAKKKKNVEIMHLSGTITRLMMGLRFTSCKSGKDRTSVAAVLEQAQILSQDYDLAEHEFQLALDAMRSEGTRRENTLKNIGQRKYAFNSLQVFALPKLYRPPPGTFGATVT